MFSLNCILIVIGVFVYGVSAYADKLPYEKIDCSSFVTANRIQEIGPENNTKYAVAFITTAEYLQGYYYYDGRQIFITEQVDPCVDLDFGDGRGQILHLDTGGIPHVGVIVELDYDCNNDRPRNLVIIHANGGEAPEYGRVRFEVNAHVRYPYNIYEHTYLQWID